MGVVVRRYINFLILFIPTPLVTMYLLIFAAASLLFVHLKKKFFVLVPVHFYNWGKPERVPHLLTILLCKILLIWVIGSMHGHMTIYAGDNYEHHLHLQVLVFNTS